jgi:perosamine synthetase
MPQYRIPWWMPQIGGKELEYVKRALDANFVNEGSLTVEFEEKIASFLGARFAFATTSGTAAIFLALKALGIGHGDEVIVPDVTFIATANAVDLCGATPVLADVLAESFTLDPRAFERAITPRTKAVIPVHVSGRVADMEGILAVAKRHGLAVVEDAAEALGSVLDGASLGTIGDAGCFSFSPNKTITTGQGGMIVTNREDLAARMRPLKDQGRPRRGTGGDDLHDTIGYNFRYTDIQAALGLGQLHLLKDRIARMKRTREIYVRELADVSGTRFFRAKNEEGMVPQWTDIIAERRDELVSFLAERGMDCRKYWLPIHRQNAYAQPDDAFPVSTALCPRALWLPSAFTLSDDDVTEVCAAVKRFYQA